MRPTVLVTAVTVAVLSGIVLRSPDASAEEPEPVTAPAPVDDSRPLRRGFTMELGLGVALTLNTDTRPGPSHAKVGLAPLSLSLGGFVSERVALLGRIAGTSFFEDDYTGKTVQYTSGFYGAHVQYWFTDRFMMSGGPGFSLFGKTSLGSQWGASKPSVGYALSIRAAYAVFVNKHHALRLALEAFPVLQDGAPIFGSALNFEWQYY